MIFASIHHAESYATILERTAERAPAATQVGCTAEGVLATGVEIEDAPGLSVWVARLPAVEIEPVRLTFRREDERGVVHGLDVLPGEGSALLLLVDPFSFPADHFLSELNRLAPGVPVIGGVASGGNRPGATKLFFQGRVLDDGAVGARLSGRLAVATVVSQGCRPIGSTYRVTRAEANILRELDGAPALRRLEEVYETASERERTLLRQGVHLGVAVGSEFVNRNVLGADQETGALAVGDLVEEGNTVRFQIRDAESADEDLRLLLDGQRLLLPARPAGALLFSCNGRGQRLFGRPHHDVGALERAFGRVPVAGFFAQGELGPIGGQNFLHGFTASVALFLPHEPSV